MVKSLTKYVSALAILFSCSEQNKQKIDHYVSTTQVKQTILTDTTRGCVYGYNRQDTTYMIYARKQEMPCERGAVATWHYHRTGLTDLDISDKNQLYMKEHPEVMIITTGTQYVGVHIKQ